MYNVKIDEGQVARMNHQELVAWCRANNWDENNELSDDYLINEAIECEIAEQMAQFSPAEEAKERALFVAFYYWQVGHPRATLWVTFDDVYALSGEFVQTYSPDDTWEDTSFEDYMLEFIKKHTN
jgi:hypothetical protein